MAKPVVKLVPKPAKPAAAAPSVEVDPFQAKLGEQRARIAQEAANAVNEALAAMDKGFTLDGVRLTHPSQESGHMVDFRKGEAEPVVAAVRKVLQARAKAK